MSRLGDIRFHNKTKIYIRNEIVNSMGRGEKLLDFYGTGQMYRFCKRMGVNILSIDNGKDFRNRVALKKEFKNSKDRMVINLRDLADRKEHKFSQMWLDYCCPLGSNVFKDLEKIPQIMENEGCIYITYRLGHERVCPKGMDRRIIDSLCFYHIERALGMNGVELIEQVMKEDYVSYPKYKERGQGNGTHMVTIGFKWKK